MPGPSLAGRVPAPHEPRQPWKVLFAPAEVLRAVPCGTLAVGMARGLQGRGVPCLGVPP